MEKNCFSLFLTGYMRKQYCVLLLLLYALTTNAQMYVGGTFGFTTPFIIIVRLQTRITAKMQHNTAPTMNRILFDVLFFVIRQSSKRVLILAVKFL